MSVLSKSETHTATNGATVEVGFLAFDGPKTVRYRGTNGDMDLLRLRVCA